MAFAPVDIPIVLALETDNVVDFRPQTNSNLLLLKDQIEDLLNNLEIDVNNLTIGTDNPIKSIRTDNLILDNTGFVFQTGTPSVTIASLVQNGAGESVLSVDRIIANIAADLDAVTLNSLTVNDGITIGGEATVNAPLNVNSAVRESKENVVVVLSDVANVATGTIVLSSTSRQNIFVSLEADTSVYTGGGLVPAISKIELIIDFDSANPPAQNQEFTIYIVDAYEQGVPSNSIVSDINIQGGGGIPTALLAGTNLATTNAILMHSDLASQAREVQIGAGGLIGYEHNASLLYIIDAASNDRLMIKNLVEIDIV
jgi:hypothetical protein